MITKLLKYDIKSTSRLVLPLYGVFIIITLINQLLNPFEVLDAANTSTLLIFINVLSIIVYFIMIIAVIVGTFIILIQRFYNNLLGSEGYLSHTLPVKTWQHTLSKVISFMFWIILSICIVIVSFIMIIGIDTFTNEFPRLLKEVETVLGTSIYFTFPLYMIVFILQGILTVYNSITIGHQFHKYKIVASFVTYGVFYFITQIISLIAFIIYFISFYGNIRNVPANPATIPNANLLFGTFCLISLLISLGHYLSMNYFLKNRLNLE